MAKLGITVTDEIEKAVIKLIDEGIHTPTFLDVYGKMSKTNIVYFTLWRYLEEHYCEVYNIISTVVKERSEV